LTLNGVTRLKKIGHYFQTRKRLRQGVPLSTMIFNIVADLLAIHIERTKEDGQVGSIGSIVQYVDDTILFMEHNFEKSVNMNLIICILEKLSSSKINFHKSVYSVLERNRCGTSV
jgi:hypothetical protein